LFDASSLTLYAYSLTHDLPLPLTPTFFPYTTLFRSVSGSNTGSPSPSRVILHLSIIPASACSRNHASSASSTNTLVMTASPKTRSEEHTSELQSRFDLVCRLLLETKKTLITMILFIE